MTMRRVEHATFCECGRCQAQAEELRGRLSAFFEAKPRPGTVRALSQRYLYPKRTPKVRDVDADVARRTA